MAEAMAPRGPDGAGAWSQGRVALGHRRLKIIDLSEAGAQPMVDSDLGLAIAWNGCIYNYKDLRRELTGHGYRFFSTSDTEVLLKAYHHWGDRFVDRLYGMFAFAIVERDSGRVLLGRDRLGIKPLYITEDADRVRFASSLPALLAGGGVDNPGQIIGPNDADQDLITNPDHTLLFAVNPGSNTIAVFNINGDGSLTPVKGSPFPSGGVNPVSLGLTGNQLYVVNKN